MVRIVVLPLGGEAQSDDRWFGIGGRSVGVRLSTCGLQIKAQCQSERVLGRRERETEGRRKRKKRE